MTANSSPPPWTPTHIRSHNHTHHPTYIHTPLLSSTYTLLDLYTLNPNQTATLVKPYKMLKTVQMAGHAQLRSLTAVGIKEFSLLLVLCASGLDTGMFRVPENRFYFVYKNKVII